MDKQEEIIAKLAAEKKHLEKLVREAEKRLAKAPDGSVRVTRCRNYLQFYRLQRQGDRRGVYMPAAEKDTAIALIQKRYDKKLLRHIKPQIDALERFLRVYDPNQLEEVYDQMSPAVRDLLAFAELPNEVIVKRWMEEEYKQKGFAPDTPEHYTLKNERVRSKSEVMLADALYHAGIPYRYECPLYLQGATIHPDFTILRPRDLKEIYLEHFGLLDEASYRNDAMTRVRLYEQNSIFPGDRLIVTAETYRQPLNLALINGVISRYLI